MADIIAIDLGGSKVRVARANEKNEIIKIIKSISYGEESAFKITDNIINLVKEIGLDNVKAIGLALACPINPDNNDITLASNLSGFKHYDLVDILEKQFNLPVKLFNDANAAGYGEALMGAGRKYKSIYYLTHSTGIGGAYIYNQEIIIGKHGYAGEIGNLIIDNNAGKINHLNAGALENICSGKAVLKQANKIIDPKLKDVSEIFSLAKKGNIKAGEIISQMSDNLAKALSIIAHILDPDCFVIGGGISRQADYYFPLIRENYLRYVHENMTDIPILKAELAEAGICGTILLTQKIIKS